MNNGTDMGIRPCQHTALCRQHWDIPLIFVLVAAILAVLYVCVLLNGSPRPVSAATLTGAPDFSTSVKFLDETLFAPGDAVTYTVFVSNSGTAKAYSAAVLDLLPAGAIPGPGAPAATLGQVLSVGTMVSWTGSLLPGAGALITIPVTINTCDWPLTNTALASDPAASGSTAISVSSLEGFEGLAADIASGVLTPTFPPDGWSVVAVTGTTATWNRVTLGSFPTAVPYQGTAMAQFNSYYSVAGDASRLQTRALHFPAGYAPLLSFWVYHETNPPGNDDRIQVQISLDGATFQAVPGGLVTRLSDTAGWVQHSISLTAYAGQASVRLGFLGIGGGGDNIYIDEVGLQFVPLAGDFTWQPVQPLIGQPVTFTGSLLGVMDPPAKAWTFGDGTTLWQGGVITHVYDAFGPYTVGMIACGLTVSHTVYVSANPVGIDVSLASSRPVPPGVRTYLTATVSSASWPITASWEFGDGNIAPSLTVITAADSSTSLLISHTYTMAGLLNATLSVTNTAGTLSTTLPITVLRQIFLPVMLHYYPPIPDPPVLDPIDNSSANNSYAIAWTAPALAISYTLQEDTHADFEAPVTIYQGASLTWSAVNRPPGVYYYRVMAWNAPYASAWSNSSVVTVQPLDAPILNPIVDQLANGSYSVTWNAVRYASVYTLEQDSTPYFTSSQIVYAGAGTAWSIVYQPAGTYYYRVQAGNAADSGPWSASGSVSVLLLYDGNWAGTTSQVLGIGFSVAHNAITSLTLSFVVGGCSYNSPQTFAVPVNITGNTFTLNRSEATFSYVVTGTFSSAAAASGGLSLMAWDPTSDPPCVGTATATWTAYKAP